MNIRCFWLNTILFNSISNIMPINFVDHKSFLSPNHKCIIVRSLITGKLQGNFSGFYMQNSRKCADLLG